jgi:hypothetical protein
MSIRLELLQLRLGWVTLFLGGRREFQRATITFCVHFERWARYGLQFLRQMTVDCQASYKSVPRAVPSRRTGCQAGADWDDTPDYAVDISERGFALLCAKLRSAAEALDLDSFCTLMSAVAYQFARVKDAVQYHRADLQSFVQSLQKGELCESVLFVLAAAIPPECIDLILDCVGRLVSVSSEFSGLFGGDDFFQCLLALGNIETHLNLFLAVVSSVNPSEANLEALMNFLSATSQGPVPCDLITAIFARFGLDLAHAEFLLRRLPPLDSESDVFHLCSVLTVAIHQSAAIADFVVDSGLLSPLLACSSSDNLTLMIPVISLMVSLMNCNKDAYRIMMECNFFPSLNRLLDSESESDTIVALDFLSEVVPDFVSCVFDYIECDLLWPILYDGIVLGGIEMVKAAARLTHRLVGLHDEFNFAFLHDDVCAIGVRLLDLTDDEFTGYVYDMLEFTVQVAERSPVDRDRFLGFWEQSALPEQIENAELLARIAALSGDRPGPGWA